MTLSLAGRRVLVIGLGVSGFAAAGALNKLSASVRVTEEAWSDELARKADALKEMGIEVEIGGHDLDRIDADVAVVSPGIPLDAPIIQALRGSGTEIVGEVEIAYRVGRCDWLAVTGTNGKTTTTSLLASMLAESGIPSAAAGNIGRPAIEAVTTVPRGGAIALEVSSFQLETIDLFHPRVAVLLNVAEDHTDWHGSFANYARAKARVAENQTPEDFFVANADDSAVVAIADRVASRAVFFSTRSVPEGGIGVEGGHVVMDGRRIVPVDDVPIGGVAGLEDCMAAAAAALLYGADERAIVRAIKGFRPPRHRLEVVAEIDGVTFIDDSKATNPHATLTAVRGLSEVVLIAGGRSKGIDLAPLADTVPPVRGVVALGEAAEEIERVFTGLVPVVRAGSMLAAVRAAIDQANGKGSVLLSPGCASLDMFENYAARGEAFVRAVWALMEEEGDSRRQPRGDS